MRPEALEREDVKAAAERRQEYPVPNDLTFQPTSVSGQTRSMRIEKLEDAKKRELAELLAGPTVPMQGEVEDFNPPAVLENWIEYTGQKRRKLLHCLTDIEQNEITTRKSLSNYTGIPDGTIAQYLSDNTALEPCVEKKNGVYELTNIGETALEIQWGEL